MGKRHIGTMINEEKWRKFTLACVHQNTTKTKVIRNAINEFIEENLKVNIHD
ncbi:MAG: plasmid partition protein ParG [Candidatus Bathyarchaeota archaeon]|nr:plasmid partition protein ParG [Candidatus Bathyarchaeota archaeon]